MDKSLVDQLGYSEAQKRDIKKLYADENCRFEVQKAMGFKLASIDYIITTQPLNQLCLLTSQAQFADSDTETVAIAVMLLYCLKLPDVLPSLAYHRGKAFAARSLVSLGLFRQALEEKWRRYGAPSPDYYRKVGQLYFHQAEMDAVADHFQLWESFISERFA